jgi:capsular exopolysaccharide synthesis family protein
MNTNTKQHPLPFRREWSLRDYLALVIRGRWTIVVTFVVAFGASILYSVLAERVYRSTASVRIDMRQLQSTVFRESNNPLNNLNIIQNELQILRSNSLADAAAKKLLEKKFIDGENQVPMLIVEASKDRPGQGEFASQQEVASRVKGALDFEPVRDSDVIKIIASSGSAREAALIANVYAEAYLQRNVYGTRTKSRTFREFLESQLKEKQAALGKSEESVRNYMEKKGVVSLDEESRKVIEQLSQLEAQRDAVDISIQALSRTISSYQEQMSQQEQNVAKVMGEANDPYIRVMQAQLAQLEVQRDITVAQNPDFVGKEVYNTKLNEIDGQIQALKAKLKKRTDEFLINLLPGDNANSGTESNPASYLKQVKQKMLEAQIELQSLQARKEALGTAVKEYDRQFENLPRKNMEFARLQREKGSTEKLYLTIEEKYNEANINEQGELGYIDIFDAAVPPPYPASPRVGLNLLLGFVSGLSLGFLIVFAREQMQDTMRTPEDVKRKGFVVLTTVGVMKEPRRRFDGNAKALIGKKKIEPRLVMLTSPMSPESESYRQVRTSLNLARGEASAKVILVTSPEPGEGKTTTASNLAISFAQAGRSVLLVDADLRQPTVHSMFDLKINPGLSEILSGYSIREKVEQESSVAGLRIVTSGPIPANPVEYLDSEGMKRFMDDARRHYDVVILDSPPVLAVTDTVVLSAYASATILVISSGSTGGPVLDRCREMLEVAGTRIVGVVINNFDAAKAYGLHGRTGYGYYGYGKRPLSTKVNPTSTS